MRVLYLGMMGEFSRIPLEVLLSAGAEVCGVVVPGEKTADSPPILPLLPAPPVSELPLLNPFQVRHIVHLAWEQGIPAFELYQPAHPQTAETFSALSPDVVCVACFSRKIPKQLLEVPPQGFLNLHPSLLPAYRGPAPLFWQFRQGEVQTGVTVHVMDEGLDTGDIVLQTAVPFPDGLSGPKADRLCAQKGSELLVEAIERLKAKNLPRIPQSASRFTLHASRHPWPQTADFIIPTSWSARRAFNFIRGTVEWGPLHVVQVEREKVIVETAVAYRPAETLGQPMMQKGHEIYIQFTPGVLHITGC